MKTTELFFPFEPKPKGRPRFTRTGHAYTPQATQDYEKHIAEYYKEHTDDFYDGPIKVRLTFCMPIPKTTTKKNRALIEGGEVKYIKKPDLDNLCKSVTDGLNGIAYADDSLITQLVLEKRYTSSISGTELEITEDV